MTSGQMNRREFIGTSAVGLTGMALNIGGEGEADDSMFDRAMINTGVRLKVLPVLTYEIPVRKKLTSWRKWGGIQTSDDLNNEKARITAEIKKSFSGLDFPLEVMPLAAVPDVENLSRLPAAEADVVVIYAAGGDTNLLDALIERARWGLIFLRHRSGPNYLWYEIIHPKFLRRSGSDFALDRYANPGGMNVHDVVVDDYGQLLWRLRALYGLKNTYGKRIVSLGEAGGWGSSYAPILARDIWRTNIREVTYDDLAVRIKKAFADKNYTDKAEKLTAAYLGRSGTSLKCDRDYVTRSFVLYQIIKDYMAENDATSFTIRHCMSTVMQVSKTTACLPLSILNDEGYTAFCESDFNVIPSGMLLHYVSGKPVFLHNPTYPHDGVITIAHCTAPRRMDGVAYDPVDIVTHFESDFGAAPKVGFRKGQKLTTIAPDCEQKKWLGFNLKVQDSPFYPICRSQMDVAIEADCTKLMEEMKGFHWMTAYGDYLKEMEYAVRKAGIEWEKV